MRDADFRAQRKRVRRLIRRWVKLLNLEPYWNIEVHFYDDEYEFLQGSNPSVGARVPMSCWCRWEYGIATIQVCVPVLGELTDAQLERAVVHELCHPLVNELREADPDNKHEERVVCNLVRCLLHVKAQAEREGDGQA